MPEPLERVLCGFGRYFAVDLHGHRDLAVPKDLHETEVLAHTVYAAGRTISGIAFCYGAACPMAWKWWRGG